MRMVEELNVEVGDVYTYKLKQGIGNVVRACKRPFIIIEVRDDSVIGVPLTTRLKEYTDARREYMTMTVNGKEKNICILTDVPIELPKNELNSKIATVRNLFLKKIIDKAKGYPIFSDLPIEKNNGRNSDNSNINIDNEAEFLLFFDEIKNIEEAKELKLERDSNLSISSNTVILDRKEAKLSIPIEYRGVAYGELLISFMSYVGEDKGIKKVPHKDKLELVCVNFDEMQETFSVEPIQVALLNEKKISIHVLSSIKGVKENVRVVQYTLFMEK